MSIAIGSKPLLPSQQASTGDIAKAAGGWALAGTAVSGAGHYFLAPNMPMGRPLATATLGVGLMTGLAAGALTATNQGGESTNNILTSMAISGAAFGVPGIWIHGKMNPLNGMPVPDWKGTLGVAATGALVGGLLLHHVTQPD